MRSQETTLRSRFPPYALTWIRGSNPGCQALGLQMLYFKRELIKEQGVQKRPDRAEKDETPCPLRCCGMTGDSYLGKKEKTHSEPFSKQNLHGKVGCILTSLHWLMHAHVVPSWWYFRMLGNL